LIQGADIPLYAQLKLWIKEQIASGELKPYDMLPGERRLTATHRLSRTTVRQALNELVMEGVLFRRHGKGTFVAPPRYEHNLGRLVGFAEELHHLGLKPTIKVLVAQPQIASADAADRLRLQPGETVVHIERLVSARQVPIFIDRIDLTAQIGALVLKSDLTQEPIYSIIERHGYPIRSGVQSIHATALTTADARLLGATPGSPALRVARTIFIDADSPIEYSEAIYCGHRYEYRIRLER